MFQIQINDNYYNVNGVEAAWDAFRRACEFVESVGGDTGDVFLIDCELADQGKPSVVACGDDYPD
jgi:hypothetical protein